MYCECGCGELTPLAKQTVTALGHVKGKPLRFIRGHNRRGKYKPLGERYVEQDLGYKTPCWIWQEAKTSDGYGYVSFRGKACGAHRALYTEKRGEIPKGLDLDHLCRQPSCVNPDHLEPVTHAENTHRGRNAKLSREKVRQIREMRAQGYLLRDLAVLFEVSWNTVERAANGRSWREP